ncbi:MAG: hypothetical protein WDW38_006452 [Sanguina aurantia]
MVRKDGHEHGHEHKPRLGHSLDLDVKDRKEYARAPPGPHPSLDLTHERVVDEVKLDLVVDGETYQAIPIVWLWMAPEDGLFRILLKNCLKVNGKVCLTLNRVPGAFKIVLTVLQKLSDNPGKSARDLLVLSDIERDEVRFYGILPPNVIDLVRSVEDLLSRERELEDRVSEIELFTGIVGLRLWLATRVSMTINLDALYQALEDPDDFDTMFMSYLPVKAVDLAGHGFSRVAAAFRYESKEGSDYTEAHFVHCVRRYLSVEICSNQRSMQLHAAFESMCELVEQAHLPDDRHRSSKIKVIGDDHDRPDWFTAYFSTTPPSLFCFEPFLASCQAAVCINSMYAGDLDIRMVTATLATYGITVDIGHDHDLPSKIVPLPDTLYLRRVRGNHYNWMDFLPPRNHGMGAGARAGRWAFMWYITRLRSVAGFRSIPCVLMLGKSR